MSYSEKNRYSAPRLRHLKTPGHPPGQRITSVGHRPYDVKPIADTLLMLPTDGSLRRFDAAKHLRADGTSRPLLGALPLPPRGALSPLAAGPRRARTERTAAACRPGATRVERAQRRRQEPEPAGTGTSRARTERRAAAGRLGATRVERAQQRRQEPEQAGTGTSPPAGRAAEEGTSNGTAQTSGWRAGGKITPNRARHTE